MRSHAITGMLFIITGLTPLLFYGLIGPDGPLNLLEAKPSETIAAWLWLCLPIALMRTTDAMRGGAGFEYVKTGFLLVTIVAAAGLVHDAFGTNPNNVGLAYGREAISGIVIPAMMLGLGITGIGFIIQKYYQRWLSILITVFAVYGFFATALLGASAEEDSIILAPFWFGFPIVFIAWGIVTILKKD